MSDDPQSAMEGCLFAVFAFVAVAVVSVALAQLVGCMLGFQCYGQIDIGPP